MTIDPTREEWLAARERLWRWVEADPLEPAITDEMVDRAAEVIADECGYALYVHLGSEPFPNAPYWKRIARRALEAALGGVA